ncbi:alpha/beta fold hydrolase [Halomicroarcula sp. S1AR25-4]|uniref:alpha/beta hydrolase n=1 Tax=Haloarcula sp. S1AR25-4 TaxID=2950538 RepID=UPI002875C1BF|nr:alpha/beta fold hydrolase [Halomicroarcula sp. S1AR25-4]MDS0279499.1 alpha/beta fold hydrolase [Halomicroarcula sp. S1AR25-4]
MSPPTQADIAREVVQTIANGQATSVFARFAPELLQEYTAVQLLQAWREQTDELGRLIAIGDPEQKLVSGTEALVVPVIHRKGIHRVTVVFEDESSISGLWLSDISSEQDTDQTATCPSYVDQSAFDERSVSVPGEGKDLPGTLAVPRGTESPPGVVLVHGSGPADRDGRVGSRYPLRDIGLGLASHGIATLRYDKRTFVEQLQPRETTIERVVVDDAVSALDRLRAEGVSPCGVVGHSLGGMLAPRIASEDGNTDAICCLAANARPLSELVLSQIGALVPDDGQTRTLSPIRDTFERAQNGSMRPDEQLFGAPVTFWKSLRGYDACEAAAALSVPMLFVQGREDRQVRADVEFEQWRAALGDRRNVTFSLYEGLDHLLTPASDRETTQVSEAVLEETADWLLGCDP